MQGSVAEVKLEVAHQDKGPHRPHGVRRRHASGAVWSTSWHLRGHDRDKYERELLSARKIAEDLLRRKPPPKRRSSMPNMN